VTLRGGYLANLRFQGRDSVLRLMRMRSLIIYSDLRHMLPFHWEFHTLVLAPLPLFFNVCRTSLLHLRFSPPLQNHRKTSAAGIEAALIICNSLSLDPAEQTLQSMHKENPAANPLPLFFEIFGISLLFYNALTLNEIVCNCWD
jgi:hypothetical protein